MRELAGCIRSGKLERYLQRKQASYPAGRPAPNFVCPIAGRKKEGRPAGGRELGKGRE